MLSIVVLLSSLVAGVFWPGALWAGCFFTYQVASISEVDSISMVYVVLAVGVAGFHALRRPPPVTFGRLDAVFFLFIACYSMSAGYMRDASVGAAGAGQLLLNVVTMYLIGRLTCQPDRLTQTVREMLLTMMVMGTVLAAIIFHSRTLTTVRVARLAVGTGTDVGLSGPFPFILLGGTAGIFFYSNRKQFLWAGICAAALAIVGYISIYSATRGVYVAAAGGLIALMIAGRRKIKLGGAITLGVLGLIGLIAVIPFMPHTIELQNSIMRLLGNFHGGSVVADASTIERANTYHLAIELFLQHPLLGIGIGGYNYTTGIIYVHNLFLEIACEFGIVGLILLSLYLVTLFQAGWRLSQAYSEAGSIVLAFVAVHLTHMMVSDTLSHAKVVFMFTGVISGVVTSIDRQKAARLGAGAPSPVAA